MGNNETFHYTYSAKQQDEIEAIRKKYLPKPALSDHEAKLERLRQLDAGADRAGLIAALTLGMIGLVLFSLGMCCVTVWEVRFFVLGIVLGVLGLIGMAAAWPLRRAVTARKREQIAPEVLKLTEELSREN